MAESGGVNIHTQTVIFINSTGGCYSATSVLTAVLSCKSEQVLALGARLGVAAHPPPLSCIKPPPDVVPALVAVPTVTHVYHDADMSEHAFVRAMVTTVRAATTIVRAVFVTIVRAVMITVRALLIIVRYFISWVLTPPCYRMCVCGELLHRGLRLLLLFVGIQPGTCGDVHGRPADGAPFR